MRPSRLPLLNGSKSTKRGRAIKQFKLNKVNDARGQRKTLRGKESEAKTELYIVVAKVRRPGLVF